MERRGFNTRPWQQEEPVDVLKVTHYTIASAHDMPLKRFKDLLNSLASSLKIEVA